MNRTSILHVASRASFVVAFGLMVAGCGASHGDDADPSSASANPDDMTPEEVAAGAAMPPTLAADGTEPTVDPETGLSVATPAEPSESFLEPDERALPLEPQLPVIEDPDSLAQTDSCHRATGYRSGHAFTICLTTIDGHYVEVNTARAYLRMRKAARASSVSLRIVSGFRSMAEQRYLYHCYLTKRCNGGNLAAVPGYSNHQSGHALDLNTSSRGVYSWLTRHGHSYGFRRTVPSEIWHWEH